MVSWEEKKKNCGREFSIFSAHKEGKSFGGRNESPDKAVSSAHNRQNASHGQSYLAYLEKA